MNLVGGPAGPINLQATLSASSAGGDNVIPHHPITCPSQLRYEEDGTFACEHVAVGPDDVRTRFCVQHSIALLLLELAAVLASRDGTIVPSRVA